MQREPFEGQTPTERTEVRILYSKREVYFGITCFDSEPKKIVATELRRDVPQELDDYFEIVIDSAHDRRNAYVFQINPLGTQRDALITEEQRTDSSTGDGDSAWDGVWTSEARITKEGWAATIGIPFSTLNFMQSRDVVWGINFKRFIRRKNEEDLWSGWRRVYGAARVSQAGELRGISEIGSGRLFIVKPYGLTGFSHFPSTAAGTGFTPGTTALYTGGVDVKLGLRSNLVANFTANTDFADADEANIARAEADVASAERAVNRQRAEWTYASNNLQRLEPLLIVTATSGVKSLFRHQDFISTQHFDNAR